MLCTESYVLGVAISNLSAHQQGKRILYLHSKVVFMKMCNNMGALWTNTIEDAVVDSIVSPPKFTPTRTSEWDLIYTWSLECKRGKDQVK